MNNYSWNLGPDDYIEHAATGEAHYSKNWDKAKQGAYNKAYYIKNKNRILARKQQLRAKQAGKELNYIANQTNRIVRDTANEISDAVNRDYAVTKFRNGVNDRIDSARDTANRAKSNARNNIDLARSRMNSGINSTKKTANNAMNEARSKVNSGINSAKRTVSNAKRSVSNAARDAERRAKQTKNNIDAGIYKLQSTPRTLKNKARYEKDLAKINARNTVRNAKYRLNKALHQPKNITNTPVDNLRNSVDNVNKKLNKKTNKKKNSVKDLGRKKSMYIV